METNFEAVKEYTAGDPDLQAVEKETCINFSNNDDRLHFFSSNTSLIRHVIAHTEFEVKSVNVDDGDSILPMDWEDYNPDEGDVVSVKATAPIGLMKFGSSPRSTNSRGNIISRQRNVTVEDY